MKSLSIAFARIWPRRFHADDESRSCHLKANGRRKRRPIKKEKLVPVNKDDSTCIVSSAPSSSATNNSGSCPPMNGTKAESNLPTTLTIEDTIQRVHQHQKACKYRKYDTFEIAHKGKGKYRRPSRHLEEGC